MFSETAEFYDIIYSFKDYQAESETIKKIILETKKSPGNHLLDVACGTGLHLEYLQDDFKVEGLDLDEDLLSIARKRNPGINFHRADMTNFDLHQKYDAVICMFSSIGYVKTLERLGRAIACMASHLVSGGLLLVEPWYTPDRWEPGTVHARFIDEPELKIARINNSFKRGRLSYMDMHYLIGVPEKTEHFVEHHELGLFTVDETREAFTRAGLNVSYDPEGPMGRGLYTGIKTE